MKKVTSEGFLVRKVGLCKNDSLVYQEKIAPLPCLRCVPWTPKQVTDPENRKTDI